LRSGWLTVDITYDDATFVIERILVECHAPVPIDIEIFRSTNSAVPWRTATLSDGDTYDNSRPIGGGIKNMDDLTGIAVSVEF
jgi:hypothetical protein